MEVFHLVGLSVVVAVAAVVHAHPYGTAVLVERPHHTVKFRHEHTLLEEFLVARLRVQARCSHAVVTEPHETVTVGKHADDAHPRGLAHQLGLLAVGERVDGTAGRRCVDVETVGVQTGDPLVG